MIELRKVSKRLGESLVLDDLSFLVPEGSTYALLGLSGSGKTTALKLVCGLHAPDRGEVLVRDIPVVPSRLSEIRGQVGYVIQDGGLFPHLTAYQNIHLVGREAGWEEERIRARIAELASIAKLPLELLGKYQRQLSGGQRQRVGLMRALLRDPPVLLLDEPLGALDPITRSELQAELRDLFRRLRKTVLLVTHDLFEAGFLAERILLLSRGRVLQAGSLRDLIEKPADEFARRFVQSQRHEEERG